MKNIYEDFKNGVTVTRLRIDAIDDVETISRFHKFENQLTVAYKYQGRVFVAFERQETDPFEVTPAEEARKAFDAEDWETLERLAL